MARAFAGALMVATGVAVAMFLGGSAAIGAPACTLDFTNTAGGSWSTAANWSDAVTPSTHRVPAAADVACIPTTVTGAVTYAGTSTVKTLTAKGRGGLAMTSGTLTLSDAANGSAIKGLTQSSGTISGAGALTLSGASTWNAGTMQNTGGTTVASGATLAITSTGGYAYLYNGATLTNHGTITITNGNYLGLTLETNATLTNAADGTIDLHGDNANLRNGGGTASTITNNGTIEYTTGTATTTISVPLTNGTNGRLRVDTGTLTVPSLTNFASSALNGGVYVVSGTLQLAHTQGTFVTNNASITLAGATSTIVDDQSHDLVAPMATNNGSLTLIAGRSLSTTPAGFTNTGTVNIGDAANASTLTVAGPYTQTAGSTTVALGSTLTTTGTSITGGTLRGAGTVTAAVATSGNGTVQNASTAGALNLASGYSGSGHIKSAITSASKYDRISITGTGDLTASKLALSTKAGYAPPQGQTFTILTCSTVCNGPFQSVSGTTMSDGAFYQITYAAKKVTLTAIRNADVSIANVDSSDPIPADAPAGPHSTLTYTVTITNNGPAPANGVVVTDALPHLATVTNAPASCAATGDTQTCTLGTIASAANVVLNFVLRPSVPGTLVNTVSSTAVAGSPDPVPSNNTNVAQSTVVTAQPHTSYVVVDDGPGGVSYAPVATAVKKLGARVQFDFFGTASHHLVSNEGAIDTGVRGPGDEVAIAVTGAGAYSYHDTLAAVTVTGTITAKPAISGTGTSRTVTWASVAPPPGFAFDVRVQTPTGTIVLFTGTTTTGTTYTADQGPGTYKIRVRLRRTSDNKATGYATSRPFTV